MQSSYSQYVNFNWAKQMGGSGYGKGYLAVDLAGNVYTTGNFNGTIDFDPGQGVYNLTCNGQNSVYISKLDPSGNFVWAKELESDVYIQVNAMITDASGNVYTTGFFYGEVDFDPGPGSFNLNTGGVGRKDMFISKLNANGDFVWVKLIGKQGATHTDPSSMATDASGNIYATGFFSEKVDFDPGLGTSILTAGPPDTDMFILKLNASGDFIWVKQLLIHIKSIVGGYAIEPLSIKLDMVGNIYTTGYFEGIADFDPGSATFILSNADVSEIFVCKLDPAGNFIWAKKMDATPTARFQFREARSVAVDPVGNVYTAGYFQGKVDFDPGPGVYTLTANDNNVAFISKLDAMGNFVWAKQISGDSADFFSQAYSINITAAGNIIISGHFNGKVDLDPGPGIFNFTSGAESVFISCLDANGNFVWAKKIGNGQRIVIANSSVTDALGNIYTTGYFGNIVDFDPGAGVFNLSAMGPSDIYVHKMSPCFNSSSNTVTASSCKNYILNGQTYTTSGLYTQLLTNTMGCDSVVKLDLTIDRKFSSISAAICPGQNYLGYTTTGTYIDTLTTANGCDSLRILNLSIKNNCPGIYIPNAFTPNGDAKNDIFKPIILQEIQNYNFIVFNRYGQKIFETREYKLGWDGTFKGKQQPLGSYVYHLKFINIAGQETVENGSVLLIK